MNNLNIDNIIKKVKKQMDCFIKNCKETHNKQVIRNKEWEENKNKIITLYAEKKITSKQFIADMVKNNNSFYDSKEYRDYVKCVLKTCYKSVEENLDMLLALNPEIKYKKPVKYTVKDDVNIIKMHHYNKTILPISKSPEYAIFMVKIMNSIKKNK